jgi:hypothetical protein
MFMHVTCVQVLPHVACAAKAWLASRRCYVARFKLDSDPKWCSVWLCARVVAAVLALVRTCSSMNMAACFTDMGACCLTCWLLYPGMGASSVHACSRSKRLMYTASLLYAMMIIGRDTLEPPGFLGACHAVNLQLGTPRACIRHSLAVIPWASAPMPGAQEGAWMVIASCLISCIHLISSCHRFKSGSPSPPTIIGR